MWQAARWHFGLLAGMLALLHAGSPRCAEQARPDFFSGANITNLDKKTHIITYQFKTIGTKVCYVRKPTPTIARGLVSSIYRRNIKGLKIIRDEFDGVFTTVTAELGAGASIYCLCTQNCNISVTGVGTENGVRNGKTVVIKSGKLLLK